MDWNDLKALVDGWHEEASAIPDYVHTGPDGEGMPLLLLARRSKDGGVTVRAMTMEDYLKTFSVNNLMQAADALTADFPTTPISEITDPFE